MEPAGEGEWLLPLLNGADGDPETTRGVRIHIVLGWQENNDTFVNKVKSILFIQPNIPYSPNKTPLTGKKMEEQTCMRTEIQSIYNYNDKM